MRTGKLRRIRRGQVWHDGDRRFIVVERAGSGDDVSWRCVVEGGDVKGGWCSPEFLRGLVPDRQRVPIPPLYTPRGSR